MSYLQEIEQQQGTSPEPVKKKRGRKVPEDRNRHILRVYGEGATIKEIAAAYSLSTQSVYNIIRKGKQQQ